MSVPQFTRLVSRVVVLLDTDVDTDQIIPARYLKVTDKAGLGDALFADWRARPGFPIGAPESAGAHILLAGNNFGCGSSREHAPWALVAGGFRAIVSTSFADIFRGNALKNGLVPVVVPPAVHAKLVAARTAQPGLQVTIDLEAQELRAEGVPVTPFTIDGFARRCLLDGVDELGFLLRYVPDIVRHEERRALPGTILSAVVEEESA
ncbi:3-isopropylmalate dehydratase small subunit [Pendulispora albinea]|uniref:3-isopropylmalate dehydratase small subunit n=1 Tax=Pendulispora albinea TaxID=2741071 RepID=A0ABZ2M5K5_9BACT